VKAEPVVVSALGAITPVGAGAVQTCASIRAGLSGLRRHPSYYAIPPEPIVDDPELVACGIVAGDPDSAAAEARMLEMAIAATRDLMRSTRLKRAQAAKIEVTACFAATERAGSALGAEHVARELPRRLGIALEKPIQVITDGQPGTFRAIAEAGQRLTAGQSERCLILAVDSLVDEETLLWFDQRGRLRSPRSADGFFAGEGAACLLLERRDVTQARGGTILAVVGDVGMGDEPNTIAGEANSTAQGLCQAIRAATKAWNDQPVAWAICDMNGESYWAYEWGLACSRLGATLGATELWHPADCMGAVGAAAAALAVVEADTKIGKTSVARANFVDADVTSTAVMGRKIYLAVKFEKTDSSLPATLTIKPDAKNAQYAKKEKKRHPGICAPGLTAATKIGSDGVAMFTAHVTAAGGDRFEFTAKSSKGTEISCANQIETRRKLFYQVICMKGASNLPGAMLTRFENQFWRDPEKAYIKLEQYSPGKTIANRANFDDYDNKVLAAVKRAARKEYDKSKAPFAVAVVIVNKNCNPGPEVDSISVLFNGGRYRLPLHSDLFHFADPTVAWFHKMTFTPTTGVPVPIPRASVKIIGKRALEINTIALPRGAGILRYEVTIVSIEGMGLSLPTENLVTVASRHLDGTRVPADTMAAVLAHEVGHKIGMVPGPEGDHDLDRQSSYYDHRGHYGPHCRYPAPLVPDYYVANPVPAPTCTMFGDIRTNTCVFCPKCIKSVRKLDVSPERKVGIAKQF
jgi:3-oxoacyl-[acyl-carrier-protein] synthase-1